MRFSFPRLEKAKRKYAYLHPHDTDQRPSILNMPIGSGDGGKPKTLEALVTPYLDAEAVTNLKKAHGPSSSQSNRDRVNELSFSISNETLYKARMVGLYGGLIVGVGSGIVVGAILGIAAGPAGIIFGAIVGALAGLIGGTIFGPLILMAAVAAAKAFSFGVKFSVLYTLATLYDGIDHIATRIYEYKTKCQSKNTKKTEVPNNSTPQPSLLTRFFALAHPKSTVKGPGVTVPFSSSQKTFNHTLFPPANEKTFNTTQPEYHGVKSRLDHTY
ncbi:MAG: hypothetical protein H0W64_10955 [Gammaproteobacteria bacterium]|nr:hypothetical protein [Gammaproteobacteria bacterium]